jgi:hypothetical protein
VELPKSGPEVGAPGSEDLLPPENTSD